MGRARARASIAASSSGWQNIDENGQPDGPMPMRPNRSSVVPAALRHSYTSAGSDSGTHLVTDATRLQQPTDLVVEVHGTRQGVALGPLLEHDDGPPELGQQHRQHQARRACADDGDIAVDRHRLAHG